MRLGLDILEGLFPFYVPLNILGLVEPYGVAEGLTIPGVIIAVTRTGLKELPAMGRATLAKAPLSHPCCKCDFKLQ